MQPILRLLLSGAFVVRIVVLPNGIIHFVLRLTQPETSSSVVTDTISKGTRNRNANSSCSGDYRLQLLGRKGNVEDQKR